MALPSLGELTSDQRFKALSLNDKKSYLNSYFDEAGTSNPELKAARPLVTQIVGMEHAAEREIPIVRDRINAEIPAYVDAFESARAGAPREEVIATLQTRLQEAGKVQEAATQERQRRLGLAAEYESLGGFFSPRNLLDFAQGEESDIRRREIESELTPEGLTGLRQELKTLNGQSETPAGVDSEGNIIPNSVQLLLNKDAVREYISGLSDVPENSRNRALAQLDANEATLIEDTAKVLEPRIGNRVAQRALEIEKANFKGSKTDPDRPLVPSDASPESLLEARREIIRNTIETEADRSFVSRGASAAVRDLEGVADLLGVGSSDFELRDANQALFQMGREQANPGTAASFGEGLVRLVPQILLTRGIGSGAGGAVRAFGAGEAVAGAAASSAAISFGGLQSASGAVDQVRQNGGTEDEQMKAGVLAFLTTVGVTAGFNRLGAGGVEDFTRKVAGSKAELAKALTRAGWGEFAEEASDEILNAYTSGSIANPNADIRDIASQAFEAGLYGAIFGVATKATDISVSPRNAPTANMSDAQLQARADAVMETDTLIPESIRRNELSEGAQRVADIQNVEAAVEQTAEPANVTTEQTTPQSDESIPSESTAPVERQSESDRVSEPTDSGTSDATVETETQGRQESNEENRGEQTSGDRTVEASGQGRAEETRQRREETGPRETEQQVADEQQPANGESTQADADGGTVQLRSEPASGSGIIRADDTPAESLPRRRRTRRTEQPTRALTPAEESRASRIAEAQTKNAAPLVRDSALERVREELRVNPEASDSVLRTRAKQGASRPVGMNASEARARQEGRIASIQAGDQATLENTLASDSRSPSRTVVDEETSARLRESLSSLNPTERAIIEGSFFSGKSNAELAKELGTTAKTVASTKKRALNRLSQDQRVQQVASEADYVPTTETPSQESDSTEVSKLQAQLPRLQLSPLTKDTKAISDAKKIASFLNVRVVPVTGLPQGTNGVFDPSNRGVIYLSDKTTRPEFMVVIHESLHNFAATNPAAYQELLREVSPDIVAWIKAKSAQAQQAFSRLPASQRAEEFIADFMADRLTDADFIDSLAERNPNVFQQFARLLRSLIAKLKSGRKNTEQFVKDLDRADAALSQALLQIRLQNEFGTQSDPGLRYEQSFSTTGKLRNEDAPYETTSLTEAQTVINDNYFNPQTVSLDATGVKSARKFLSNLLDPKFVKELQQRILDTTSVADANRAAAIASGLSRASYFQYVSRLNQTNPKEARKLLSMGYRLANEVKAYFDEGVSASELGLALRSLAGADGSGIAALFAVDLKGREDAVTGKFGSEVSKTVNTVENAIPTAIVEDSSSTSQQQKNKALRDGYQEALLSIDPEVAAYVKESEVRAFKVLERVVTLIEGLARNNLLFESDFDRFKELVRKGENLDEAFDLVDSIVSRIESQLTPEQRAAVEEARREGTEAARRRENATGTSRTKNPVDILGKRLIGQVRRFENPNKTLENDAKPKFEELISRGLDRSEFVEAYVAIGGTAEVAPDVYDHLQRRNARIAERQEARDSERQSRAEQQARERQARAEERANTSREEAQSRLEQAITALGQSAREARRPTAQNDTFQKAFRRFIDLKTASTDVSVFEQQLREFVGRDGNPLLSEDQVQQISAKAIVARQEALAARSAKLEADRVEAESRDVVREINRAERLFDAPQRKDRAKRSLSQIIEEEFINNPDRRIQTEAEQIQFAREVLTEMTDLSPENVNKVADRMVKNITAKTEEAIFRAIKPFYKALQNGGLTGEMISKAIRLQALDPSKDFMTSVAALSGWEGLKPSESETLMELERQIGLVGRNSPASVVFTNQQTRLIYAATGLPPKTKDLLNTYLVANKFSGITTAAVGATAGAYQAVSVLTRDTLYSVFSNLNNPSQAIREVTEIRRNIGQFLDAGLQAAAVTYKYGTSPIEMVQSAQESSASRSYVDPLTRKYDQERRKLADLVAQIQQDPASVSNATWKKLRSYVVIGMTAPRLVLRNLTAFDAAATAFISNQKTNILRLRAATEAGITAEKYDAIVNEAMGQADSIRRFLENDVGITDQRLIQTEVIDRIQGAITQGVMNLGANVSELRNETISDIRAKLGTGVLSEETLIGSTAHFVINNVINNRSKWLGKLPMSNLIPAVRTVAGIQDEMAWDLPGINILRYVNARRMSDAQRLKTYPNIIGDWQWRERQTRVIMSNVMAAPAFALMMANRAAPDEEKWFWFTGGFPTTGSAADIAKWQKNRTELGWDENMLIIGRGNGQIRIRLDRGAGEALLLPMLLTRIITDATDGVDAPEAVGAVNYVADTLVPGWGQITGLVDDIRDPRGSRVRSEILNAVPFSSGLRSPRRILGPTVDRKTTDAWMNWVEPFYASRDSEGIVTLKNVLGEPVAEDSNPMRYLSRAGFPISFRVEGRRDPIKKRISDDFLQVGYNGGRYLSSDFKKKLDAAGISYTPRRWEQFNEARINAFQKDYITSRDRILRAKDPSAAISSLWRQSTPEGYKAVGVKK